VAPVRSTRQHQLVPAITETFECSTRREWRAWLARHHATRSEVWLVADLRESGRGLSYLDAVEEALCFGWVDGLAKKFDATRTAQRFTPRRPKSNWTELNKARARRLQAAGAMTAAGRAVLPDLSEGPIVLSKDIEAAFANSPGALAFFRAQPELYQRVRLGYVEEQRRNAAEFSRRLGNLIKQSAAEKRFGNWDDSGLRRSG
jgi:uncharacterized protein YdeI (YjbR/CyaY-like superfamily)